MSRVTWKDLDSIGGHGKIGEAGFITIDQMQVRIASISWSVTRNDPKPHVLRTEIPGWKNARHHETMEAAKLSVDRILIQFAKAAMEESTEAGN